MGYIKNEVKRFKIFVGKRAQTIKGNPKIEQYEYISLNDYSADDGSKGLRATKDQESNWLISWSSFPLETRVRINSTEF